MGFMVGWADKGQALKHAAAAGGARAENKMH